MISGEIEVNWFAYIRSILGAKFGADPSACLSQDWNYAKILLREQKDPQNSHAK